MFKICKPHTMYGQVLLTVFAGIAAVHCLMLFVTMYFGIKHYQTSFLDDRARYVFTNYILLNAVHDESRVNMAELLSNRGFEITLLNTTPPLIQGANATSSEMVLNLIELSQDSYPYITPTTASSDVSEIEFLTITSLLTNFQPKSSDGQYKAYISLPFEDGSWVLFTDYGLRTPMPRPYSFTITVVSILIIGIFALFIVYRILQPLKLFAQATEKFGLNVTEAQPLEVKGPLEVRETIIAFNKMQERILQFVDERSRLLAAISHDLRTPLTRMNLRIEQLQEPLKTAFSKDINQLRQLMDTSIDLGRATANTEKPAPVDIISLLESIVDDLNYQGANIEFCTDNLHHHGTVVPITLRPLCIKRALVNILENASRYAPSAKVCVQNSAHSMTIDVMDNGPGIPEEMLEKVFEPFFRLEPSRNRGTGGTGLGLAITRTMVQLCRGTIQLSNMPQGGLKVSITIPRQ